MRERILVVDDDPVMRNMLSEVLRSERYEAVVCADSKAALIASEREIFELALLDVHLPDMNGLELAAILKEHNPAREIVFITGSEAVESAVKAIKVGAYDYLRKPFSINELILCLRRFEEKKALRRRVQRAEQRYFKLVQHVPLLIFVLRKDLRLEFVNRACFTILGYTPEEALSTPDWFSQSIHPQDLGKIERLFHAALDKGGRLFSSECRMVHKDGHTVHAIIRSIPSHDDDGEESDEEDADGFSGEFMEGIIVDISDRVFLEMAVVQREKLRTLGAIASEVAHQIRNPLVSIGGFARRLEKKVPDQPEVGIILRECMRLEKMLQRIGNYLKPVEMRQEECSINALLSECIELLSPDLARKQASCSLDLGVGIPVIVADRELLGQVFVNLIHNAIETMEEKGVLTIKSYETDQFLQIDFRNHTNKQIKDPEALFLPFDEGNESIGLPLCYLLLKHMDGLLAFNQEEEEIVFTISLPRAFHPTE